MELHSLARVLWDYNYQPQPTGDADVLIVMGTNDLGVPRHAAQLAQTHHYKAIVVTGGVSHALSLHGEPFGGTEAEVFRAIMVASGCRADMIRLEAEARHTGENVTKSRLLLEQEGIEVRSGQLVHTPTMPRRALATARKQWPEVEWRISAEVTDFESYVQHLNFETFVHGLVGDSYRILSYPLEGFQVEQPMPTEVKQALKHLLEGGYTRTIRTGINWSLLEG
jgi:uncharacterized SAM-binding protein YcdF (DUF218 family)